MSNRCKTEMHQLGLQEQYASALGVSSSYSLGKKTRFVRKARDRHHVTAETLFSHRFSAMSPAFFSRGAHINPRKVVRRNSGVARQNFSYFQMAIISRSKQCQS
jgi:hypothetical protein